MATNLLVRVNYVDATHTYSGHTADYITMDLVNDYLIWSKSLADLITHPITSDELNAAAEEISDLGPVTVTKCLLMDYSHDVGGTIYTHKIIKDDLINLDNLRYVFCFSFDNPTATIPRLEAWDDSTHITHAKNVLGVASPAASMVKAVMTTNALPGSSWVGTAIAGAANYIGLDTAVLSGAKDLYCNCKIIIPQSYSIPSVEVFCLTVRYTYF